MSDTLSIRHMTVDLVAPGLKLGGISGRSVLPAVHDKIPAPYPEDGLATDPDAGGHEWRQLWEHFLNPGHSPA